MNTTPRRVGCGSNGANRTNMNIFNVISLLGGLALFLYGMRIMGDGLKRSSSGALKNAMEKVTNNPFAGFLLGLVVTAVIQSSTATIVLTSGLVGAGIITLHQSLGIILGANVGTTVTGQIIRLLDLNADAASWLAVFKPSTLAPLAAVIGILLIMAFRFRSSDTIGGIAMGFGILFTGLMNMTAAVTPLSESAGFAQLFVSLADKPVLGFLAGTGVAFLLQSSSATVGILQALSTTGQLTLSSIYSILIGIYMGDCITTAIVCSIGAKANAKRTGVVHILVNLSKGVLVLAGVTLLHRFGVLDRVWSEPLTSGGIANTNTLFNLATAILLLPVCTGFERISCKLIRDDTRHQERLLEQELQSLDKAFFSSPALALSSAHSAISAMANLAGSSVSVAMDVLFTYDAGAVSLIQEDESYIDTMADRVSDYLIRLSPHVDESSGNDQLNYYIKCVSEFERIGDYAVNLTENADELRDKDTSFSPTAQAELGLLRQAIDEILAFAQRAFVEHDLDAARRIEPIEEVVDDLVADLRTNHILRLRDGKCNAYAGFTFQDILVNAERIADQCSNIGVYTVNLLDERAADLEHDYIRRLHSGEDPFFNAEYRRLHEAYYEQLAAIEAAEDA